MRKYTLAIGACLIPFLVYADAGVKIEAVLLHPVFDQPYLCSEHWDGQFKSLGDALGTDCFIHHLEDHDGKTWLRPYKTDGSSNADWYGWQANVLAPFDGTIRKLNANPQTNKPGLLGAGVASFIVLQDDDGLMVMIAHIDAPTVKIGQRVKAGQVIAKVGNNGQSRHPHVHVGAWKDNRPLQIRFDQKYLPKM